MGLKEDVLALAEELDGVSIKDDCESCLASGTSLCRGDLECAESAHKACAKRLREIVEHDAGEVTTVSAYDLLPDDERKAIAWVREHGGLDAVEKRLMPAGMEWPRFEDGEPVRIEDEVHGDYGLFANTVEAVEFISTYYGVRTVLVGDCLTRHTLDDTHVKRPAPKALDADGVEISVGDTVYLLPGDWCGKFPCLGYHGGEELEVFSLHANHVEGGIGCRNTRRPKGTCYPQPSQLTHRAPVLAADGEPLEVGQTVYAKNYGYVECTVLAIEWVVDGYLVEVENEGGHKFRQTPDEFTHQRPVLDADGEEIREGDVLYSVETGDYVIVDSIEPGNPWFATTDGALQHCAKFTHRAPVIAADGKPLREGETVYDVEDEKGYPHIVTSTELDGFGHVKTTCEEPTPASVSIHPNRLTHEQPDTWERLEEDARQLDIDLNDTTDDYPRMSFCRDLVRRCRALAERGEL